MASREEMGKALYRIWDKTLRERFADDREIRWADIAEKFAAWLRERGVIDDPVKSDPFAPTLTRRMYEYWAARIDGRLVCPKGHVLTHPEDIARRFCGTCREFLP